MFHVSPASDTSSPVAFPAIQATTKPTIDGVTPPTRTSAGFDPRASAGWTAAALASGVAVDLTTAASFDQDMPQASRPAGDPEDPSTWKARKGKGPAKRPAWNPITRQWVKPVSKGRGRPTRDTLGKVWLDWAGLYVDAKDPRAQFPFVHPVAVREMEIRLEKEKERVAKLQSSADVRPHTRPTDPFGGIIFAPPVPAPRSEYRVRHDEYLQHVQYGSLVQSNVSNVPPTQLEHALHRVGKHEDQPRLSALNARRIELYEYKLEQMDLILCENCSRLRLVDVAPANTNVRIKLDPPRAVSRCRARCRARCSRTLLAHAVAHAVALLHCCTLLLTSGLAMRHVPRRQWQAFSSKPYGPRTERAPPHEVER